MCLRHESIVSINAIPVKYIKIANFISAIIFVSILSFLNNKIAFGYFLLNLLCLAILRYCHNKKNDKYHIIWCEMRNFYDENHPIESTIFNLISKLKIFDPKTLEIFYNKFHTEPGNGVKVRISDYALYSFSLLWWVPFLSNAIPTCEALDTIVSELDLTKKKTLSVGSGNGLWELLLSNRGCDVICTDTNYGGQPYLYVNEKVVRVSHSCVFNDLMKVQAIQNIKDIDVLFLGWPEPDDCDRYTAKPNGYDERALLKFEGEYVILTCDENNIAIVSTNAKTILAEKYEIIKKIKLPFCKNIYNPVVLLYKKITPSV